MYSCIHVFMYSFVVITNLKTICVCAYVRISEFRIQNSKFLLLNNEYMKMIYKNNSNIINLNYF